MVYGTVPEDCEGIGGIACVFLRRKAEVHLVHTVALFTDSSRGRERDGIAVGITPLDCLR